VRFWPPEDGERSFADALTRDEPGGVTFADILRDVEAKAAEDMRALREDLKNAPYGEMPDEEGLQHMLQGRQMRTAIRMAQNAGIEWDPHRHGGRAEALQALRERGG
jgi:hypothetical protein